MSERPEPGRSAVQVKSSACFVVGLLSCLATAQPAQAASFDCAKAAKKVEKLVCADPELSKLDEELNVAYKVALRSATTERDKASMRAHQREWVATRDACDSLPCLRDHYQQRYEILLAGLPSGTAKAFQITQNDSNRPEAVRMCRDFERNLNDFPPWPPMACERKLSPNFPQFRRPAWRQWSEEEIWRRRVLLKQVHETAFKESLPNGRISDVDWDRYLERQLGAKQIRVNEAPDIPQGGQFNRWLAYEAARLPDSPDPYTQLQRCTQYRNYVKLTADGSAVAVDGGNRMLGLQDFLVYRDEHKGEVVFLEGWNVDPGFQDAELRVDDTCVIRYGFQTGNSK